MEHEFYNICECFKALVCSSEIARFTLKCVHSKRMSNVIYFYAIYSWRFFIYLFILASTFFSLFLHSCFSSMSNFFFSLRTLHLTFSGLTFYIIYLLHESKKTHTRTYIFAQLFIENELVIFLQILHYSCRTWNGSEKKCVFLSHHNVFRLSTLLLGKK